MQFFFFFGNYFAYYAPLTPAGCLGLSSSFQNISTYAQPYHNGDRFLWSCSAPEAQDLVLKPIKAEKQGKVSIILFSTLGLNWWPTRMYHSLIQPTKLPISVFELMRVSLNGLIPVLSLKWTDILPLYWIYPHSSSIASRRPWCIQWPTLTTCIHLRPSEP